MPTIPDTLRYSPVRMPPNEWGTSYWKVMDLIAGNYMDGKYLSAESARAAINRLVAARAVAKKIRP